MTSGRARQRNRFSTNLKHFKVVWKFTPNQYLVWRMFHIEAISFGADYFTMPLLIDDVVDVKTCRIVEGTYAEGYSDGLHSVSATVEVENMELTQYPGLYELIETLGPDWQDFIGQTDRYHILIHTTIPEANTPLAA